jgi:dTDP-4-amino-4,6-dideoxygalactose transaminase
VTTDDDEIAHSVRMLRSHGSRDKVTFERIGFNSRLDELQAALLRVLLPNLDGWADGRRAAARRYAEAGIAEVAAPPRPVDGADPAWHLYVIRHARADDVAQALGAAGIGHKAYYRTPVHRQPAMRQWASGTELPATEEAARTHLAIPMSPVLDRQQADQVVRALRAAAPARRPARA